MTWKNCKKPVFVAGLGILTASFLLMPICASALSKEVRVRFVNSHYETLLTKLPDYVAQDRGLFQKHGVNIEFISGSGGGNTLRVLSTGNVDMAEGGLTAAILAARTDPNIELVGAWNHSASSMVWIAPQSSPVHSVTDLKKAKLGYSHPGSASQRLVQLAIKRAGVPNVSFVSVGGMGDNWAASRGGVITAGWAMEPFLSQKIQQNHARILLKPGDYVKNFFVEGIDVNKNFARKHSNAVKGVFSALVEAIHFIKAHQDAAARIGARHYHASQKVIAAGIKRLISDGVWDIKMDPKAFNTVIEGMVEGGQLDKKIDIGKLLNQSYLPKTLRTSMK